MRNHFLTTGGFLRGNQCGKSLYLNVKYPELEINRQRRSKNESLKRKMAATLTGHLFPNGKFSGFDTSNNIESAVMHTKNLIEEGTTTIFNACFLFDRIFCVIDILHNEHGRKSITIKCKDDSFDDIILAASLQYYVMQRSNYSISDYLMLEYNPSTDSKGKIKLDYNISSIKEQISFMQDFIVKKVLEIRHLLDSDTIPQVKAGEHCKKPYPCEYLDYCEYSGIGDFK